MIVSTWHDLRVTRISWLVVLMAMTLGCAHEQISTIAKSPTTQPDDEPRNGLISYFDAIRRGDEAGAFACWLDDIPDRANTAYDLEQVHLTIRESIADAKFGLAVLERFPSDSGAKHDLISELPDPSRLASAQYTQFRRLAIIKWSGEENDALPMVFDNSDQKHSVWKISIRQYRETTRSSVGDSVLLSGWFLRAKEMATADVRAGRVKSAVEAHDAVRTHFLDIAKTADTQPAPK